MKCDTCEIQSKEECSICDDNKFSEIQNKFLEIIKGLEVELSITKYKNELLKEEIEIIKLVTGVK